MLNTAFVIKFPTPDYPEFIPITEIYIDMYSVRSQTESMSQMYPGSMNLCEYSCVDYEKSIIVPYLYKSTDICHRNQAPFEECINEMLNDDNESIQQILIEKTSFGFFIGADIASLRRFAKVLINNSEEEYYQTFIKEYPEIFI